MLKIKNAPLFSPSLNAVWLKTAYSVYLYGLLA